MKKEPGFTALRFAGMAFQMGTIVALALFLGKFLDRKFPFPFPVFTLSFVLLGAFSALYLPLKDLLRGK